MEDIVDFATVEWAIDVELEKLEVALSAQVLDV
jgi:hypothetical protein